jgi:hypothetical protein
MIRDSCVVAAYWHAYSPRRSQGVMTMLHTESNGNEAREVEGAAIAPVPATL